MIDENNGWRDIVGFEGFYKINTLGDILSVARRAHKRRGTRAVPEKLMKTFKIHGYVYVMLQKNGSKKTCRVHRLLAEAFIPAVAGKSIINHINGVKDDNRIENLEWCTVSENTSHAYHSLGSVRAPSKKFDDINMLAYATCIPHYPVKSLEHYMSFSTFRHAVRGKTKYGCSELLRAYLAKYKKENS
jgi:hypothetical protein